MGAFASSLQSPAVASGSTALAKIPRLPVAPGDDRTGTGVFGFLGNFGADIADLAGGLWNLAGTAGSEIWNNPVDVLHEFATLGLADTDVKVATPAIVPQLGAALVGDVKDRYLEGDTMSELYDHPLSFLLDVTAVAGLAGAGARVAAGQGAVYGRLGKALAPATVSKNADLLNFAREARIARANEGVEVLADTVRRFEALPTPVRRKAEWLDRLITEPMRVADPTSGYTFNVNPTRNPLIRTVWSDPVRRKYFLEGVGDFEKRVDELRAVGEELDLFGQRKLANMEAALARMKMGQPSKGIGPAQYIAGKKYGTFLATHALKRGAQKVISDLKMRGILARDQQFGELQDLLTKSGVAPEVIEDMHLRLEGLDEGRIASLDRDVLEAQLAAKGFASVEEAAEAMIHQTEGAPRAAAVQEGAVMAPPRTGPSHRDLDVDERNTLTAMIRDGKIQWEGLWRYNPDPDLVPLANRARFEQEFRGALEQMGLPRSQQDLGMAAYDSVARRVAQERFGGDVDAYYGQMGAEFAENWSEGVRDELFQRTKKVLRGVVRQRNGKDYLDIRRLAKFVEGASPDERTWYANARGFIADITRGGRTRLPDGRVVRDSELFADILAATSIGALPQQQLGSAFQIYMMVKDGTYESNVMRNSEGRAVEILNPMDEGPYGLTFGRVGPNVARMVDEIAQGHLIRDWESEIVRNGDDMNLDDLLDRMDREAPLELNDRQKVRAYAGRLKGIRPDDIATIDRRIGMFFGVFTGQAVWEAVMGEIRPSGRGVDIAKQITGARYRKLSGYLTDVRDHLNANLMPDEVPYQLEEVQSILWAHTREFLEDEAVRVQKLIRRKKKNTHEREDLERYLKFVTTSTTERMDNANYAEAWTKLKESRYGQRIANNLSRFLDDPKELAQRIQGEIKGSTIFGPNFSKLVRFYRTGDFTTVIHELGHVLRRTMPREMSEELHQIYFTRAHGVRDPAEVYEEAGPELFQHEEFNLIRDPDGTVQVANFRAQPGDATEYVRYTREDGAQVTNGQFMRHKGKDVRVGRITQKPGEPTKAQIEVVGEGARPAAGNRAAGISEVEQRVVGEMQGKPTYKFFTTGRKVDPKTGEVLEGTTRVEPLDARDVTSYETRGGETRYARVTPKGGPAGGGGQKRGVVRIEELEVVPGLEPEALGLRDPLGYASTGTGVGVNYRAWNDIEAGTSTVRVKGEDKGHTVEEIRVVPNIQQGKMGVGIAIKLRGKPGTGIDYRGQPTGWYRADELDLTSVKHKAKDTPEEAQMERILGRPKEEPVTTTRTGPSAARGAGIEGLKRDIAADPDIVAEAEVPESVMNDLEPRFGRPLASQTSPEVHKTLLNGYHPLYKATQDEGIVIVNDYHVPDQPLGTRIAIQDQPVDTAEVGVVVEIDPRDIKLGNDVRRERLEQLEPGWVEGKPIPLVFKHGKDWVAVEGNHRVWRSRELGQEKIKVGAFEGNVLLKDAVEPAAIVREGIPIPAGGVKGAQHFTEGVFTAEEKAAAVESVMGHNRRFVTRGQINSTDEDAIVSIKAAARVKQSKGTGGWGDKGVHLGGNFSAQFKPDGFHITHGDRTEVVPLEEVVSWIRDVIAARDEIRVGMRVRYGPGGERGEVKAIRGTGFRRVYQIEFDDGAIRTVKEADQGNADRAEVLDIDHSDDVPLDEEAPVVDLEPPPGYGAPEPAPEAPTRSKTLKEAGAKWNGREIDTPEGRGTVRGVYFAAEPAGVQPYRLGVLVDVPGRKQQVMVPDVEGAPRDIPENVIPADVTPAPVAKGTPKAIRDKDVEIGATYRVKVGEKMRNVRITGESRFGGWDALNVDTGRTLRIKTARRLRELVAPNPVNRMSDAEVEAEVARIPPKLRERLEADARARETTEPSAAPVEGAVGGEPAATAAAVGEPPPPRAGGPPPGPPSRQPWTREMEEAFAEDLERWFYNQINPPDPRALGAFRTVADGLVQMWRRVRGFVREHELVPEEAASVFDGYLGKMFADIDSPVPTPITRRPRRMRELPVGDLRTVYGDGKDVKQPTVTFIDEQGVEMRRRMNVEELRKTAVGAAANMQRLLTPVFGKRVRVGRKEVRKLRANHADGARIMDAARARVTVDSWLGVDRAVEQIASVMDVVGVDDTRRLPGHGGARVVRAYVRDESGLISEIEVGTQLWGELRDSTFAHDHMLTQVVREVQQLEQKLARLGQSTDPRALASVEETERALEYAQARFTALDRMQQGTWEMIADEIGESYGGATPGGAERRLTQRMRLWVMRNLETPYITDGSYDPIYAFERQFLPLRIKSGAEWHEGERISDGNWYGGDSAYKIDDDRASAGLPQPTYFPHMESPGSATDLAMASTIQQRGHGHKKMSQNKNYRRNRGVLFDQGNYITDVREAYSLRAARGIKMRDTYELVSRFAREFGRAIADPKDLADGEVVFAPEFLQAFVKTAIGIEDRMGALLSKMDDSELVGGVLELDAKTGAEMSTEIVAEGIRAALNVDERVEGALYLAVSEAIPKVQKQLLMVTKQGLELYALPRNVAQQLYEASKYTFGPNTRIFWDKPTAFWRAVTLYGGTRWVVNNIFGNTLFAGLGGVRVREIVRAAVDKDYQWYVKQLAEEYGGEGVEIGFGQTVDYPVNLGAAADTIPGRAEQALEGKFRDARWTQPFRKWAQGVKWVNTHVENHYRRVGFVEGLRKADAKRNLTQTTRKFWGSKEDMERMLRDGIDPGTASDALDEMNSWFGDYQTMTPFERGVVRRFIFPFWGFYRHMLKMMVKLPFDHPGKAKVMYGMSLMSQDLREEFGPVPTWMDSMVPFGAMTPGGKQKFLSTAGPNPFNVFMDTGLGLFHPVAKAVFEQLTGRDAYTGREFSDPDVFQPFGSQDRYRIIRGPDGVPLDAVPVEKVVPGLDVALLSQFPQYDIAKQVLAGGRTYDTSGLLESIGNPITDETGEPIAPYGVGTAAQRLGAFSTYEYDIAAYRERLAQERENALMQAYERWAEQNVGSAVGVG